MLQGSDQVERFFAFCVQRSVVLFEELVVFHQAFRQGG